VHPDRPAIRKEQRDGRARTYSGVPDKTAVGGPVLRFAYFIDWTNLEEILWTSAIEERHSQLLILLDPAATPFYPMA
jgi:hypothetical protein